MEHEPDESTPVVRLISFRRPDPNAPIDVTPPETREEALDRIRAWFFVDELPPRPDEPDAEFVALAAFTRALDAMPPRAQKATIAWLADKYLGVRIR